MRENIKTFALRSMGVGSDPSRFLGNVLRALTEEERPSPALTSAIKFAEAAHRQSVAVAASSHAADDQAFIDALSHDEG